MSFSSLDTARVFTNEENEVVFADHNFYRLLRREQDDSVIGQPLSKTLGLKDEGILEFLRDVVEDGYIRDTVLEFTDRRGVRIRVTATGRSATDERGNFIGANLELWGAVTVLSGEQASEVIGELPAVMTPNIELGIAQGYFVAHVSAMYVLLMRSVGPHICTKLDQALNKAAQRAGVSTRMNQGLVSFDDDGADAATYATLLAEVVRYSMDVLGKRMVERELDKLCERVDERTRAIAGQYRMLDLMV